MSFTVEPLDDDAAELVGYRTVSALAIAGLVLGLASPLCVFGRLLLMIPIAGVAVSLVSLRRIAASGGALVGRQAAIVGLILSIASGTAIVSYDLVTRQLRVEQAAAAGRRWIETVRSGDIEGAYYLSHGVPARESESPEGLGPGENPYLKFFDEPAVKALSGAGKDADIQFAETVRYGAQGGGEFYARQRFVVTPRSASAAGRNAPIRVLLQLHRTNAPGAAYMIWLATPVEDSEVVPNR